MKFLPIVNILLLILITNQTLREKSKNFISEKRVKSQLKNYKKNRDGIPVKMPEEKLLGKDFMKDPQKFVNDYSFSTFALDSRDFKGGDFTKEWKFNIRFSTKFNSNILFVDPEGPINGYYLRTRDTLIVPKKNTFIFTPELQSCHLLFNDHKDNIEIYHENTRYIKTKVEEKTKKTIIINEQELKDQAELRKKFNCKWGNTDEISQKTYDDALKQQKYILPLPFLQYDPKMKIFQIYSQNITQKMNKSGGKAKDDFSYSLYTVESFSALKKVDANSYCKELIGMITINDKK